jgi:hypothetical protein
MKHLLFLALLALPLCIAPAVAQDTGSGSSASALNGSLQPTKFQIINRSMESLLNDGWVISNVTSGPAGAGFLLLQNRKWIVCTLKIVRAQDEALAGSECVALN